MKKIRILIADDHSVVREGLRAVLGSAPDFDVVAEASDGEEAVRLTGEKKPDVVILDIAMPRMNGIDAVRRIRQRKSSAKILIFTIHANQEYVYRMLAAGANGYILKEAGKDDIVAAVRSLNSGGRYFSPGITLLIEGEFARRVRAAGPYGEPGRALLTRRESEILRHVAAGLTNAEIAGTLFVSVRTVNTHRTNLMHKLDVHNVAGLVRYAMEHGMVNVRR